MYIIVYVIGYVYVYVGLSVNLKNKCSGVHQKQLSMRCN